MKNLPIRILSAIAFSAVLSLVLLLYGCSGENRESDHTPSVEPIEMPQNPERLLFVGDSRTIDMFFDSDDEIDGMQSDGITIYARHGNGFPYLTEAVEKCGMDHFDTLITWMGANDRGIFNSYRAYYEKLLRSGKQLVVCTVGPTEDEHLIDIDKKRYKNSLMVSFNKQLTEWATAHDVAVIDLYSYITENHIRIDPADGIHYMPRPTTGIWEYILESLK